ncbi:SR-related and CTD-associated factor 4 [Cylas formicarius]|uniref:SR-related and CTD-associated factor 4 n=1 Tax=Cylas formicarius TaxID=197179 RepID=UPI0029588650|nr:SR-related and CTD-associated factor 4 [Cylas formicarius]
MDAVKAFNQELSSLYEVKPPISKAKMTALTRGAIKAIKFYKHVVQSVEKFILKCKAEYKVPGLYVIDSIVRQSRHQFGTEKDVFAPRFTKNLQQTFINLFKCPAEDKSKVIRVLNLWQKNQVFPPEVIQPLFDLADPNHPIYKEIDNPIQQANGVNPLGAAVQGGIAKGSPALQKTPTKGNQSANESVHGSTPNLNLTEPVIQQLQQLQRLLAKTADAGGRSEQQVHFDKKLLDFDYGDDEEEVNPSPRPQPQNADPVTTVTSLLTNPEVLRQLQTLQTSLTGMNPSAEMDPDKIKKLHEMRIQEEEFDRHLAQTVPNLPFASECDFRLNVNTVSVSSAGQYYQPPLPAENEQMHSYKTLEYDLGQHDTNANYSMSEVRESNQGNDVEVITLDHDDSPSASPDNRHSRSRRRSRSRSHDRRDRDKRSRRSRSRSKSRRYRSRSKDRKDRDKKDKEKETEKEKERKRRGLPSIKKDCLSVCSTTLWVGHLSKLVHQDDLSNTFGEFGEIVSIDLIPPRGCAFIVMNRRQDAARCLTKLKNYNLSGKVITLAWAPGKGVKGKDFKDYWEGDLGVSYIPWVKIKEDVDLDLLEDGGMFDEDTLPAWMKAKLEQMNKKNIHADQPPFLTGDSSNASAIDTSQPPPMAGAGMLQPPPPLLPPVSPFLFNNRILGMMPPNMPVGVPPPTMPPPMMTNQLLAYQGTTGFMPPQNPATSISDSSLRTLGESLMSISSMQAMQQHPPLNIPPPGLPPPIHHAQLDDAQMDVEMEDAIYDRRERYVPLSEQLQSAMQQAVGYRGRERDEDERRDRRDDRGKRRSRSRDRDQRERERGRYDSRDRDRDRDRRERDRDLRNRDRDRRDRNNRWAPPERRDGDARERRDREKTLNDRLKEMAGMNFDDEEKERADKTREGRDGSRERRPKYEAGLDEDLRPHGERLKFEPPQERHNQSPPPSLVEATDVKQHDTDVGVDGLQPVIRVEHCALPPVHGEAPADASSDSAPAFDPQHNYNADYVALAVEPEFVRPNMEIPPVFRDEPVPNFDEPPMLFGEPPIDFEGPPSFEGAPMDYPPDFEGPHPHRGFDGDMDNFEGPPRPFDGPPRRFRAPPGRFGGPPRGFDEFDGGPPDRFDGLHLEYDGGPPPDMFDGPAMGGPPNRFRRGRRDFRDDRRGGPDFYPPLEDFGLRGPPGPSFGPRGIRGPRGFFGVRGLRGRGGFNPRFDGPPDFFRGPRGGMPRMFDERFPRGRGPRFGGRGGGRHGPDFDGGPPPFENDEGPSPYDEGRPFNDGNAPVFNDDTPFGRGRKAGRRSSRWGGEPDEQSDGNGRGLTDERVEAPSEMDAVGPQEEVIALNEGGGTPLRDEIQNEPVIEEDRPPLAEGVAPPAE